MTDLPPESPKRFQPIPIRYLLPNLITLLALCSGVTAIRFAIDGNYQLAVSGIIFALVLDAVDGRLARMLKGTSRFGAELDSLADFVNFGVAPAIILFLWSLNGLHNFGWVICLMLAIGCALRLARFNVALDDPNKPEWTGGYFTGIPAPAGAMLALTPLYFGFLGFIDEGHTHVRTIAGFIVLVAILMVSRVPTFSGKNVKRIPREMFLPILAALALGLLSLIAFPWESLAVISASYLCLIPVSVWSYQRRKREDKRG